jgi:hypothetical protein
LTERKAYQCVALALEARPLGERQRHYLAWLIAQADELAAGPPPDPQGWGEGRGGESDNTCEF